MWMQAIPHAAFPAHFPGLLFLCLMLILSCSMSRAHTTVSLSTVIPICLYARYNCWPLDVPSLASAHSGTAPTLIARSMSLMDALSKGLMTSVEASGTAMPARALSGKISSQNLTCAQGKWKIKQSSWCFSVSVSVLDSMATAGATSQACQEAGVDRWLHGLSWRRQMASWPSMALTDCFMAFHDADRWLHGLPWR